MIALYRSGSIAPGKIREALAFAKEISAYITAQTGVEVSVAVPVGGNPNRVGWAARFDNLAGMEEMMTKLTTDEKYMELVADNSAHFIAGSIHDEIWSTI